MLISFFIFTALPPPSKDSSHKPTFERPSAVEVEERSVKFLLKDEFLHQFGLLHFSRSTQLHDAPYSQAETPDALVSVEELTPKEPTAEASLVKCSASVDVVGSSGKFSLPSVIEEEEPPQHSGKAADEEAERNNPAGNDGDDTFEGLSDLMVTSHELFKDDSTASKLASPAVEVTSVLQTTPSTQEITLKPKSAL